MLLAVCCLVCDLCSFVVLVFWWLLVVGGCWLVCYLLVVAYCSLCDYCCLLFVACWWLRCLFFVGCCLLLVVCRVVAFVVVCWLGFGGPGLLFVFNGLVLWVDA